MMITILIQIKDYLISNQTSERGRVGAVGGENVIACNTTTRMVCDLTEDNENFNICISDQF